MERDDGDGLPVTSVPCPAPGIGGTGSGVELVSAGQNQLLLACMTLSGAHVADCAVTMIFVVPVGQVIHPSSGGIEVGEALARELRPVFGGAEEGLDERIVVADSGTRVRWLDS